ncbi:ABC transporter permease subunit [Bacillus mangrovi]|uniref:ABC transporter permease subunit n=1 Tax=Metabacillus mangrovi TaxID=1491830 RepID=A0A7X2S6C7_9BACI|nr:ABC transporter permease subunit [Metabacillus mangrovi]MTH54489.1 ABC transporter permease subunit [Metabacillus mangrovi]
MVRKGLLLKELRQSGLMLGVTMLILTAYVPLSIMEDYSGYLDSNFPGPYTYDLSQQVFLGFLMMLTAFLAIGFIGSERQRGSMEFTLSLPYSRSTIFWTKWLLGLAAIVVSLLLSFVISSIELAALGTDVDLLHYYCFAGAALIMIFTLVFSAGCLTGTPFAQAIVAVSTALLPVLTIGAAAMNLEPFYLISTQIPMETVETIAYFSAPAYLIYDVNMTYQQLLIPVFLTVLFLVIGYAAFLKHPAERNGSFFLWKQLELPVFVYVIILGTFGFGGAIHGMTGTLTGYFTGLLIGAAIGGTLGYILIYKKTKVS